MAFFNNLLWEKYSVDFHEITGFVYLVKDYCCANFRNQQSFFNTFKIEHENCDFRKSLYFYKVDAGEKNKKNGLGLGAGIILNQELSYSRHWRKLGCGRLPAP